MRWMLLVLCLAACGDDEVLKPDATPCWAWTPEHGCLECRSAVEWDGLVTYDHDPGWYCMSSTPTMCYRDDSCIAYTCWTASTCD